MKAYEENVLDNTGGGFCLGDSGCIHRYAVQYAQGAQCAAVFVHYRTSDIAPFPVPFQGCYAALRWVWDNASELLVNRMRIAVGGALASDFSDLPPAYVEVEEFEGSYAPTCF